MPVPAAALLAIDLSTGSITSAWILTCEDEDAPCQQTASTVLDQTYQQQQPQLQIVDEVVQWYDVNEDEEISPYAYSEESQSESESESNSYRSSLAPYGTSMIVPIRAANWMAASNGTHSSVSWRCLTGDAYLHGNQHDPESESESESQRRELDVSRRWSGAARRMGSISQGFARPMRLGIQSRARTTLVTPLVSPLTSVDFNRPRGLHTSHYYCSTRPPADTVNGSCSTLILVLELHMTNDAPHGSARTGMAAAPSVGKQRVSTATSSTTIIELLAAVPLLANRGHA